jgi:hypothetical protein
VNKQKKRAVSAEGEGPATAETTDPLLVLSRLLRVREAWNHKYEGSGRVGRASARFFLSPLPGMGKESYQVKAITSLFFYVHLSLFQALQDLPPANPAITEPVFPTLLNSCDS